MILKKEKEISLLIMSSEDEFIAPVIGLREQSKIWKEREEMHKVTDEASVDSMMVQLQSIHIGKS